MRKFRFKGSELKISISILIFTVLAIFGFRMFNSYSEVKGAQRSIPIAMALDDGYTYPTIVAITSAMKNANKNTHYDFYIMHPSEFSSENKNKILSLQKKYKQCSIELIDMGKEYSNANDVGHITTPAYYRLSLSSLLPNLDKIIWLDGDTIILKDLQSMFDLDVEDYYYSGFLDDHAEKLNTFGVECERYICSGVMLVNLKKLRLDDMVLKFKNFIEENNDKLVQHDQTVINYVCRGKLGKLPPKFGMFNLYGTAKECRAYSDKLDFEDKYTPEELEKSFNELVIIHCVMKPWRNPNYAFGKTWWDYAKKTDFYQEILDKYPVF